MSPTRRSRHSHLFEQQPHSREEDRLRRSRSAQTRRAACRFSQSLSRPSFFRQPLLLGGILGNRGSSILADRFGSTASDVHYLILNRRIFRITRNCLDRQKSSSGAEQADSETMRGKLRAPPQKCPLTQTSTTRVNVGGMLACRSWRWTASARDFRRFALPRSSV